MPGQVAPLQHAGRQVEPRAVVAGEDDDGLVEGALAAQSGDDFPRRPVDRLDHVAQESGARATLKAFRRVDGQMRHRVGNVEEERLIIGLLDELDGALSEARGQGALVDWVLDLSRVLIQPQRNVGLHPGRLHVVRIRQSEPVVEARADGQVFFAGVAEMPLSHHAGAVAGGFERLRQREFAVGDAAGSSAACTAELDS